MNGVNCYQNYSYYFFKDSENKYFSTNTSECLKNYKLIEENKECIDNCTKNIDYQFEFNNKCYKTCPFGSNSSENNHYLCKCKNYYDYDKSQCIEKMAEGYYFINETLKIIAKCDDKCLNCSLESMSQNKCISCNICKDFFPNFDEIIKNHSFIECYKINYNSYFYCHKYFYCDSSNHYFCTENEKCPANYTKLILNKKKCIDNCQNDNNYSYEYKNNCYQICPSGTDVSNNNNYLCEDTTIYKCNPLDFFEGKCKLNNNNTINNNAKIKDEMINYIDNEIINHRMDNLISDIIQNENKDLLVKEDNTLFQITSTENQKNNKNNNISSIILGECENILKKIYNIGENQALLIFKIDYYQPGSLIPKIGYEIYHPTNKSRLDLTHCKNAKINLNIPALINEDEIYKYDPNSEYYKDECVPSTTKSHTDILINDRQNEFNENNMSLCENECIYTGYEIDTKSAKCECNIKSKQLVISELINQTDNLNYNFTSKEESSNMVTMKCYHTLFTKNGLAKNIGSYILIFNFTFVIILGILFYKCGYPFIEDVIRDIVESKQEKKKKIKGNKNNLDLNRKETDGNKNIISQKIKKSNPKKKIKKSKSKKKKKKLKKKINNLNFVKCGMIYVY